MSFNTTLQSNNTDLQTILDAVNALPEASNVQPVEQATPDITVNANGLITATVSQSAGYVSAGSKSATKQLAFQAAKTITPTTVDQIVVSSGYYTGGAVTVKGDSNLVAGNIKSGVSIFGVSGTLEEGGSNVETEVVEYSENEDAIVSGTIVSYYNDRVDSVGSYAFANHSELLAVSFPAATTIRDSAFFKCSELTDLYFPAVSRIGSAAFNGCGRLSKINFQSVKYIGDYAFQGCSQLTTVSFPVATTIGDWTFGSCNMLETVNFPSVNSIGSSAFCYCKRLTTASFPYNFVING